jgi:predicted acylesterase/phospholipase RssA
MRRELPLLHKKPGTALVLSGGASKAFYFHIGVLKVLNLEDISSVVGTSAGAIAGSVIASGVTVDSLVASLHQNAVYIPRFDTVVKTLTSTMMFRPRMNYIALQGMYTALASLQFLLTLPFRCKQDLVAEFIDRLILSQRHAPSFFTANEVEDLFRTLLPSNDFRNTNIDLYVVATSLDSHERAVFNGIYEFQDDYNHFITDVPIHRALRASISIPGMFEPVKIQNRYYIDGEVRQTLSMDIGLALADRVIISHTYRPLYLPNGSVHDLGWFNVVKQSMHIALYERIASWRDIYAAQYPDKEVIWIEPAPDDEEFFLTPEFSFRPEVQRHMVACGERAAIKALAELGVKDNA